MMIPFAKYEGCGNDFVLIDHRHPFLDQAFFAQLPRICDRKSGIGADGLILLEKSSFADYRMRIFNADGHEAEMCGNGIRCLARFIHSLGDLRPSFQIQTMERCLSIAPKDDVVTVDMGKPSDFRLSIPLLIEGREYLVHYVNTGVPHVVLFDQLSDESFELVSRAIRHHEEFAPNGTNVNVATFSDKGWIEVRTFERGVGETLACGTGVAAVALMAWKIYGHQPPLKLRTRSQKVLEVDFVCHNSAGIERLIQSGPADFVLKGMMSYANNDINLFVTNY